MKQVHWIMSKLYIGLNHKLFIPLYDVVNGIYMKSGRYGIDIPYYESIFETLGITFGEEGEWIIEELELSMLLLKYSNLLKKNYDIY